jgi:uncharacterized protein (TIGR02300 family)
MECSVETGFMTKTAAKLGAKRLCQACGSKFYDLGKRPAICARCGAEVDLERLRKPPPEAADPKPAEAPTSPKPPAPAPRW